MNLIAFETADRPSSDEDDRPIVLLATRWGYATDSVVRCLRTEGFQVLPCRHPTDVLDAFSDAIIGYTARPSLLLIGSSMYRQLQPRIIALIRHLRWDVQIMVQVDEDLGGSTDTGTAFDAPRMVGWSVLPNQVATLATRKLSDALLDDLCHRDLRSWSDSDSRHGGRLVAEGP